MDGWMDAQLNIGILQDGWIDEGMDGWTKLYIISCDWLLSDE